MEKIREFIKNYYFEILFTFTILLAFLIRFLHTSKGLPYLYNWDEPQTASNAIKIMKTGDFNPHFFHYGSLMIYLNLIVDIIHYLFLMSKPYNTLTSPKDIKIFTDTHWHWTISHPEFYHWNRILTVLLSVLSIIVLYKLVRLITEKKWIALVSAYLIAILQAHINYSIWVTNDIPLSFFTILVIYFSVLFLKSEEEKYLYLSLIFVGVGSATKYNGAISIIMPLIALLWLFFKKRKKIKKITWASIFLIPPTIFLLIMPYAILDLPNFLKDVGFEIRNYKVLGPFATVEPGLSHFFLQMKNFYTNLGFPITIISIIGIYSLFKRENNLLRFVFIYPIIYLYFMCNTKMAFQRNFVQIYLFIAILFGFGIFNLYKLLEYSFKRLEIKSNNLSLKITIFLLLLIFIPKSFQAVNLAISVHNFKDSRTRVIEILNEIKGYDLIVFAKELRVHENDLRRLNKRYKVIPLQKIDKNKFKGKKVLYIVPEKLIAFFPTRCYEDLYRDRKILTLIKREYILERLGEYAARLDIYSIDPKILILKDFPEIVN